MIAVNVVVLWLAIGSSSVVVLRRRRADEHRSAVSVTSGSPERSPVEQLR